MGTRLLRLLGFHAYQVFDCHNPTGSMVAEFLWVSSGSHSPAIITTELGFWVTSKAGFEWIPDFHVYIRDCFASDVTGLVSLVAKDRMKDGVDFRLIILFTPYTRGSWLEYQWWPVILMCTRQSVFNYGFSGKKRIIQGVINYELYEIYND